MAIAVLKHAADLNVHFGGETHSGWLPPGAAMPLPTPIERVVLDVEIHREGTGFVLSWNAREGDRCGDLWFETLSAAEAAATEEFGIARDDWQDGAANLCRRLARSPRPH